MHSMVLCKGGYYWVESLSTSTSQFSEGFSYSFGRRDLAPDSSNNDRPNNNFFKENFIMRKLKITLVCALAVLLCAASVFGATTTLNPTDDAYVWSDDGNGNHGGDNYMIVGEWDGASPYSTSRDYLKFDLSSIPAGQTITSATLHINCVTLYTTTVQTGAHFLSNDGWGEYTITWNNAPTGFSAAAISTTTLAVGDNTWNVTNDVSIEYGGDKIYSVVMKLPVEYANADGAWFDSKETQSQPYLVVDYQDDPGDPDKDYGDAPEGVIAYPSLGITGNFPTCKTVGPAGYVEHGLCWARFEMVPPPGFDFELDGNGGLCPGFAPYDNDECFMDGDAGLIFPDAYTIQGGIVVTCPQSTASVLGNTCTTATWGTNVDIYVVNNMPVDGFVNVLMDWDQNGSWGGSSVCPTAGAPEYILQDFRVPVGFAGPLSALNPPSFLIGPNSGYIWTRFMISEAQLQNPQWDGSGIFEDGETEDYLLMVDSQIDELDFGDAPDSAAALGYPTLLPLGARHIIGGPWLGDASDGPDPEPDGQPTANADGDDNDGNDDEDGVNIPILTVGATSTITFEVNSADGTGGTVSGWIDYDGDKVWGSTATEQIVAASYPNGIYSVNVTPPAGSAGTTFARFRITRDTTVTGPTGPASDGEVEDYEVFIEEETDEELKFQQLPLNGLTIDQFTYWGHDELSTAYRNPDIPNKFEGCYMADDFADLKNSPVIKLKWWGSYLENEIMDPGVFRFLIAFEKDVRAQGHPDDADYIPSHPGEVLQSQFVHLAPAGAAPGPGEYSETYVNAGGPPCNEALFEYEAVLENPFPQDPNTVYWLKIVAMVDIDPAAWVQIQNILAMNPGMTLCDFLNLPFTQQQQLGLEQPITRWGWHNRDYTRMDPYAATPPAVVPGEHNPRTYIPTLPPITGLPDDMVWHFQDDAVAGEVFIDEAAPEMPMVDQPTWKEEYYKYSLPYCNTNQGVDGPDEIEYYSKDLAFELWTPTECFSSAAGQKYTDWVTYGKPNCWCYQRECNGDATGTVEGNVVTGYKWVFNGDLAIFLAAYNVAEPTKGPGIMTIPNGICADFNHAREGNVVTGYKRVFNADLGIFLANYNVAEPTKGPGVPVCPLTTAGGDIVFYTN